MHCIVLVVSLATAGVGIARLVMEQDWKQVQTMSILVRNSRDDLQDCVEALCRDNHPVGIEGIARLVMEQDWKSKCRPCPSWCTAHAFVCHTL